MQQVTKTLFRRCGLLSLAAAVLWLLVVFPAYALGGRVGVEDVSVFAIFCLLPGWLVFWLVSRYRVAHSQALAILSGSALRMIFAGSAIYLVMTWRGQVENASLFWLVLFYLVTLAVELSLVLRTDNS